jgi:hypothetical protein|uniref:hypothetical protein n=1 Tax=Enterocloster clostridioformis TaxID=1531 RepID=UPI0035203378
MKGRPKKEDSRDRQYRVRLNSVEDQMLNYASELTGMQKSDIFRQALQDYYNKVRLVETVPEDNGDYEDWGMDHISLKRAIECPYCGASNVMDFEDDCDSFSEERQMGPQITYSFNWEDCYCDACGKQFHVYGSIWEYPVGAYNYEDIKVEKLEDEEDE